MDIGKYNDIKEHFQLICFAAAAPVFIIMLSHIISCKFSYIMNSLSTVKLTWALISFIGREELGLQHTIKRLIISILLIGLCFFEMTNRQYFLEKPYLIGIDYFLTFVSPSKYYFQWINYYLKVGGILENAYLIQTTITGVAIWKTYDRTVQDRMLPYALAYFVSIIYYALFYIIQFYIIQKGQRLVPDSEKNKNEDNTETKEKRTEPDGNNKGKKSESKNKDNATKLEINNKKTERSGTKTD